MSDKARIEELEERVERLERRADELEKHTELAISALGQIVGMGGIGCTTADAIRYAERAMRGQRAAKRKPRGTRRLRW